MLKFAIVGLPNLGNATPCNALIRTRKAVAADDTFSTRKAFIASKERTMWRGMEACFFSASTTELAGWREAWQFARLLNALSLFQRWRLTLLGAGQLAVVALLCAQDVPLHQHTQDVLYGFKDGVALTLDVIQPQNANGYGIVHVLSTSWNSNHDGIRPGNYRLFLERGYTVFAVVHSSPPKFDPDEMLADVRRAIRFVRHQASRFGVKGERLGITGRDSGAHLALLLAVSSQPGDPQAKDPVDREPAAVAAVGCFYPVTDLQHWGTEPGLVLSGGNRPFYEAARVGAQDDAGRKDWAQRFSPIRLVSSNLPPTLLVHGTADSIFPFQQSEAFTKRAREVGARAELLARDGKEHGWPGMVEETSKIVDWFDLYLREAKPQRRPTGRHVRDAFKEAE